LDIEQNQRYSAKEIDHCIGLLTHMVNNAKDFVSLPKKKQIELIKIAGQLSRADRHQLKQRNKAIRKMKRQQIVSTERKVRAAPTFTFPGCFHDIQTISKESRPQ
jgi:hypothetical protein